MKDIVILIPAYNPSDKLLKLVKDLIKIGFLKIIIVNDGSKNNKIFNLLKDILQCDIIEYKENKGKGYALKYGINYYLLNYQNKYKGIITMDADYQHMPFDAMNLAYDLLNNQDSLILGVRNFNLSHVPKTNKYGNKITSIIFKLLYGLNIHDTQTGFRGIPNRYLNLCLEVNGNRFEYEMNMLIKFTKDKINILEHNIETVYYVENESKFNKIIDSIRIYKVLLKEYIKFILSSFFSSLIDIVLFSLLLKLFSFQSDNFKILFATFLARLISSLFNFNINKIFVFKSHENSNNILIKYYVLCIIKMFLSALLVLFIHNIFDFINETVIKIIIDVILYFISYKVQKKYIFKT